MFLALRCLFCLKKAAAGQKKDMTELFRGCCLYFDGRVDLGAGLSSYVLSKVARLHGAKVTPHLTKNLVSHVVCSQLSGAKERHALHDAPLRRRFRSLWCI